MRISLSRATTRHTCVALVPLALAVASTTAAAQGLTPEQVVQLEQVSAVALSPDGRHVAYSLQTPRPADAPPGAAYTELWIVPAAGGTPRPVVRAPASAFGPAWSPDGSVLAFRARLDQHDQRQVYTVPADGGTPRRLTQSPTGVIAYAFAPDGSAVAYTAREPVPAAVEAHRAQGFDQEVVGEQGRHVRLWVEMIGANERYAVTPDNRTVWAFAWRPDGSGFAVQTTESPAIDYSYMFRELATVPVRGGPLELVTETPGKLGHMAFSPDGMWLAFQSAVSQNDPLAQSVFVVPAAGGAATNRTPGYEGSVTWVGWQDDRTVLFLANEGTRTTLNRIGADGGAVVRVAGGGAAIISEVSFDARRRTFAAAASTAQHPAEVYVGDQGRDRLERLTMHNPWLADVTPGRQETVSWIADDGVRIEGVLVHPVHEEAGSSYPLAVLPHGGPEGVSRDGWHTRGLYPAQVLAARGYAVLLPNYRGSAGRGVAFAKADHRDLGGREFEDVIAGIDHLAAQGLVDPDRVGISGTSYGGYFSAWAATRYPERFNAGISFAGISNWISFTGTTDIPYEMSLVHWDMWWFGNAGLAWDRSPIAHIDEDTPPLLVGHGAADTRVHPAQSLELYTTLRIHGVPTGLILYPREPHGLRERAHLLDFMNRIIEWFDRYVKGGAPATS